MYFLSGRIGPVSYTHLDVYKRQASHNPKQWNALKLLNEKGEFLNAAEGQEVLRIAAAEEFDLSLIHI